MAEAPKASLSFLTALFDGSKSKIDNWSAFFMIVVALALDILQVILNLIPVVGTFLGGPVIVLVQFAIYSLWLSLKGVSYWGTRKVASKVVGSILEIIPVLNDFIPGTTLMVAAAIGITRLEEAGVPVGGTAGKSASGTPNKQAPERNSEIKQPTRKPVPQSSQTNSPENEPQGEGSEIKTRQRTTEEQTERWRAAQASRQNRENMVGLR